MPCTRAGILLRSISAGDGRVQLKDDYPKVEYSSPNFIKNTNSIPYLIFPI